MSQRLVLAHGEVEKLRADPLNPPFNPVCSALLSCAMATLATERGEEHRGRSLHLVTSNVAEF